MLAGEADTIIMLNGSFSHEFIYKQSGNRFLATGKPNSYTKG